MMKWSALAVSALTLLGVSILTTPVRAAEAASPEPYSGDLLTRSTLTGDWGGSRNYLSAEGVTFDASVTEIEQGVVGGGKNGSWEYGGRGDLTTVVDTQKLGLWPGGFLTVELEGNWADSVNSKTGSLSLVNTSAAFPLPGGGHVALPQLSFAQFVSPYAGVTVGKFDTFAAGDNNALAHGKGDTGFFNLSLNVNPTLLVVPYSPLGAGVIVLPTKDPHQALVTFLVVSANGDPSTAGFDDFHGALFNAEGRVRTDFLRLSGHHLVGGVYSNKKYTSLDQRLSSVIEDRALASKRDAWVAYYNFDQFLYETDRSAEHGVGVFGRFGATAGNPIPIQYFYSLGIVGKGLIPRRDLDQFGIGYFYSDIRHPTLQVPVAGTKSFLRDEWGFEAYYNIALTPWLRVTPSVQVIGPAQKHPLGHDSHGLPVLEPENIGTATVLGLRWLVLF
jgi:porin